MLDCMYMCCITIHVCDCVVLCAEFVWWLINCGVHCYVVSEYVLLLCLLCVVMCIVCMRCVEMNCFVVLN